MTGNLPDRLTKVAPSAVFRLHGYRGFASLESHPATWTDHGNEQALRAPHSRHQGESDNGLEQFDRHFVPPDSAKPTLDAR